MKNFIPLFFVSIIFCTRISAQTNQTLNNLLSPTAVNVDLLPASSAINIGSSGSSWGNAWHGINKSVFFKTSNTTVFELTAFTVGANSANANFQWNSGCPSLSTALRNIFIGLNSGLAITNGFQNIVIGPDAGVNITGGDNNVFIGNASGYSTTTGLENTGVGYYALRENVLGFHNTAVGTRSLQRTGTLATGFATKGNTALGYQSGQNITNGGTNTCVGYNSGNMIVNGNSNVTVGASSGTLIVSGINNTMIGPSTNTAGASPSTINGSTTLGYNAKVGIDNAMALGGTTNIRWSFGFDPSTIPAGRCLQVGTGATNGNGAYLTTGGVWTNASSKSLKENFSKLDKDEILSKVLALNISRWSYIGTDEFHVGPFAEDFYEAFRLGLDDKTISTMDPSGVALVAIQALDEKIIDLESTIEITRIENENLKREIEEIKNSLRSSSNKLDASHQSTILFQNQPNPFNQKTTIRYNLPISVRIANLRIYSLNGELLKEVNVQPNTNQIEILADAFLPGIYFYVLELDGETFESKQMIITR